MKFAPNTRVKFANSMKKFSNTLPGAMVEDTINGIELVTVKPVKLLVNKSVATVQEKRDARLIRKATAIQLAGKHFQQQS